MRTDFGRHYTALMNITNKTAGKHYVTKDFTMFTLYHTHFTIMKSGSNQVSWHAARKREIHNKIVLV